MQKYVEELGFWGNVEKGVKADLVGAAGALVFIYVGKTIVKTVKKIKS